MFDIMHVASTHSTRRLASIVQKRPVDLCVLYHLLLMDALKAIFVECSEL